MKTYQAKQKDIKRNWHVIDAKGQILGRMATEVAGLLMGKSKVAYTPHMDMGDFVVVVNAEKIELSGRKFVQKKYFHHSGYPGGLKEVKFAKLASEQPRRVIEYAVGGMLPDNKLKGKRLKRLKVVVGDKNPYEDKFKNKEQSA